MRWGPSGILYLCDVSVRHSVQCEIPPSAVSLAFGELSHMSVIFSSDEAFSIIQRVLSSHKCSALLLEILLVWCSHGHLMRFTAERNKNIPIILNYLNICYFKYLLCKSYIIKDAEISQFLFEVSQKWLSQFMPKPGVFYSKGQPDNSLNQIWYINCFSPIPTKYWSHSWTS